MSALLTVSFELASTSKWKTIHRISKPQGFVLYHFLTNNRLVRSNSICLFAFDFYRCWDFALLFCRLAIWFLMP